MTRQHGWAPEIADGRRVLHFRPLRYDRWSQSLEVTTGEVLPDGQPPLLKRRQELTREQAIQPWRQKRQQGWQLCVSQWSPSAPPRIRAAMPAMRCPVNHHRSATPDSAAVASRLAGGAGIAAIAEVAERAVAALGACRTLSREQAAATEPNS